MNVICTKWTPKNSGFLVGYANIKIVPYDLEIYGCKVFEKNGMKWINFPDREGIDPDTKERKYYQIISIKSREISDSFKTQCLKAIENYKPENENQLPF